VHVVAQIIDLAGVLIDKEVLPFLLIELAHVYGLEEFLRAALIVIVKHVNDVFIFYVLGEFSGPSGALLNLGHSCASGGQLRVQLLHGRLRDDLAGSDLAGVDGQIELVLERGHQHMMMMRVVLHPQFLF
jgi:hypothetical protein